MTRQKAMPRLASALVFVVAISLFAVVSAVWLTGCAHTVEAGEGIPHSSAVRLVNSNAVTFESLNPPALERADRWATRLRASTPSGWTVSVAGTNILVQRDKPVQWEGFELNAPPRDAHDPPPKPDLREGVYRLTLKLGPKMSMENYERLAAENSATEKERERLERTVSDISNKFHQYIAATPQEQKRLVTYREAVAKLPWHTLPDLYCEDFSIWLLVSNDGWSCIHDNGVAAECNAVFETVLRLFGMYDPRAAADPHNLGRPE